VNLPASSTISATCSLSKPGSISIASSPSSAEIYLDGILKGTAPVMLTDVFPGKHVIWCKKIGFEDSQQNIEVASGGVETFNCNLTSAPAILLQLPTSTTTGTAAPTPLFITNAKSDL